MTQQINLADPRLLPKGVTLGARHALWSVLAVFALGALASGALQLMAARTTAALQTTQAAAPAAASAPSVGRGADDVAAISAEIEHLRRVEAGQRRVRAALDAGVAGGHEGPSGYFVALARQARGTVWITGLGVAEDGVAIDLDGRMTGPHALADYLRRLNEEPLFRGRPFAQLSLTGVDATAGGAPPYTEFALRSTLASAKVK